MDMITVWERIFKNVDELQNNCSMPSNFSWIFNQTSLQVSICFSPGELGRASYYGFLFRSGFSLTITESAAFIYSAAAVVVILLSVVFVSFLTRHDRIFDDLNRAELNYNRVNAARLLTAAWIITEILSEAAVILLQIYPMAIIFGGIFLYHLAGILKSRPGL